MSNLQESLSKDGKIPKQSREDSEVVLATLKEFASPPPPGNPTLNLVKPKEKPSNLNRKQKFIIGVLLISLFVVAGGILAIWYSPQTETGDEVGMEEESDKVSEETSGEEETDESDPEESDEEFFPPAEDYEELPESDSEDMEDEPVPAAVDQDRVLYIKDENVWVVNPDGTNKIQVTTDGDGSTVRYRAIAWRSPGIVSYSKCARSCSVYTYNLLTSTETLVMSAIPFTQSFDAIEWSHDGNTLGYIFTKGDYSKEASLWSGGTTIVLESYGPPPGRGGHYDDGMYLEFSPDDTKVVVLNTIIDPAVNDPVKLFQTDGAELATLADATFPTFENNNAFYYKSTVTGNLDRWNVTSSTSGTVTTFPSSSVHDLHNSPDSYFVLFWSELSGVATQSYYDTGGSPSAIAGDYTYGKWLDDSSIYVVASSVSGTNEMGFFEIDGLSRVKRTDGTALSLDTGWISVFEIE